MDVESELGCEGGFVGWEAYPVALSFSPQPICSHQRNARLKEDSERLFVSNEDVCLEALRLGSWVRGARDVRLVKIKDTAGYLAQSYSWSQLQISEELCRKLFTSLRVHPNFLDIVHIFGEKVSPVEESFVAFFAHKTPFSLSLEADYNHELGYNIKYVEEHGRTLPNDPYSIRETGVYQKFNSSTNRSNWIFIQPSTTLRAELVRFFSQTRRPSEECQAHGTVLIIASDNWRFYINYLEETFAGLMNKGMFTDTRRRPSKGHIEAEFSDIRRLHILIDKIRRLTHILHMNLEVGIRLQEFTEQILARQPSMKKTIEFETLDSNLKLFVTQHQIHQARLDSILQRADGTESMIQNILNFRNNEAVNQTNESMHAITKQSSDDNKLMAQLAHQSTQDTRSMMIIALMSAVFLPATFVATLFGSNFFGFEVTNGRQRLLVATNIWIYFVVTLILLTTTVAGWWWWWKKVKSNALVGKASDKSIQDLDIEKQLSTL